MTRVYSFSIRDIEYNMFYILLKDQDIWPERLDKMTRISSFSVRDIELSARCKTPLKLKFGRVIYSLMGMFSANTY